MTDATLAYPHDLCWLQCRMRARAAAHRAGLFFRLQLQSLRGLGASLTVGGSFRDDGAHGHRVCAGLRHGAI